MQAKKEIIYGSVKNNIVSSDLAEERRNCDFNVDGGDIFKYLDYYANFKQYKEMN